jgi:death-on-curing family protein
MENMQKGQVILYKNKVEVRLDKETVWLTQKQMADLFVKDVRTINEHIVNIFKEKELKKESVIRKFRITAADGKIYGTNFYNLDVIISVGYRVKSVNGTKFRTWATNILRKHLVDGYTLNEKRLKADALKYKELKDSVRLLTNVLEAKLIVDDQSAGLIKVISDFTQALDVLDRYDRQTLELPKKLGKEKYKITYAEAIKIINGLKEKFGGSSIFGRERDQSFKSSLNAVYQTFNGKDLYPSIEEKTAHLLYFIVKNHSFVDGNKRIAAAVFIYFLERNGLLYKSDGSKRIADNALVALTLMIAESRPQEKDVMVKVVVNLLSMKD